jgi:hypothetical protein
VSSSRSRIDRTSPPASAAGLAAGRAALDRGDWEAALHVFESLPPAKLNSRGVGGLGLAAWWLDLGDTVFDVRERAYRAYRERGDALGRRAWPSGSRGTPPPFRGEQAIANGWLQRAAALDGQPDAPEHAWLAARAGIWALLDDGDPHEAERLGSEAVRVGQAIGAVDYEMVGRAVHGFARVTAGAVAEGLQELDEVNAAVLAGELRDRVLIGLACCYSLPPASASTTTSVRRSGAIASRRSVSGWIPAAVRRLPHQYASVCMWRGAWDEAEHELTTASDELAACRPAMTGKAWCGWRAAPPPGESSTKPWRSSSGWADIRWR